MRFSTRLLSGLALGALSIASPLPNDPGFKDKRSFVERDGTKFTVFEHAATGAKLEFVKNSGICETTPGVNQYSGYLSVGTNENMWFWFFEARNNPTKAPLATWFNGGPGCSSMIGLFQENGPCRFVNGETTPSLNPYSWNNYANMLYIDQPIGVGFSYGTDPVTSTTTAAPLVWKFIQAFYAQFSEYENRDFGIWTESYGGHYGPAFADYFDEQNAAITTGSVSGENVRLVALGVNDGLFDSLIQERSYIDYAYQNDYRQIIDASRRQDYLNVLNNQCIPALKTCRSSGTNSDCVNANYVCNQGIEGALIEEADFDVYDIRAGSNDPNPPKTYNQYLANPSVVAAIGAQSTYQECADAPGNKFARTGDIVRTFLPALSDVVNAGVRTVVWAGDADYICNWIGNQAAAEAVTFPGQAAFTAKELVSYTVNGATGGTFKTQDNLSFLRVFGAGHEVPFYTPALALQVFEQTMKGLPLSST